MAKYDIFISYSSKDKSVHNIVKNIESAGFKCWIASRDITAGTSYARAIMSAINSCSVCIVFLSANSIKSESVLNEIENVLSMNKHILPCFIDDVQLTPEFNYYLKRKHWLNLNNGINELLGQLRLIIPPSPDSQSTPHKNISTANIENPTTYVHTCSKAKIKQQNYANDSIKADTSKQTKEQNKRPIEMIDPNVSILYTIGYKLCMYFARINREFVIDFKQFEGLSNDEIIRKISNLKISDIDISSIRAVSNRFFTYEKIESLKRDANNFIIICEPYDASLVSAYRLKKLFTPHKVSIYNAAKMFTAGLYTMHYIKGLDGEFSARYDDIKIDYDSFADFGWSVVNLSQVPYKSNTSLKVLYNGCILQALTSMGICRNTCVNSILGFTYKIILDDVCLEIPSNKNQFVGEIFDLDGHYHKNIIIQIGGITLKRHYINSIVDKLAVCIDADKSIILRIFNETEEMKTIRI